MQKEKKKNNMRASIDSPAQQCDPHGHSGEPAAQNSFQNEKIEQMVREEVARQSKTMIVAVGEAVSNALAPLVGLIGGIFQGMLSTPSSSTPCTNGEESA